MNKPASKFRGKDKTIRRQEYSRLSSPIDKPSWIKVKPLDSNKVTELKTRLRDNKLHTVCEEAFCPNIGECFANGTATFMILGDICTRRCSFCDVAHGKPKMPDPEEPTRLADSVLNMKLNYVVVTSVDRDDLEDGGSRHFVKCIRKIRDANNHIKIEILTPDFKKCMATAIDLLSTEPPDVFNHNMETVSRLYRTVRPGSDYQHSLNLLQEFKNRNRNVPTKSGIMLGLGEDIEDVFSLMQDLIDHDCDMLTVGQYLQPSKFHHPVVRYVTPDEFDLIKQEGLKMGFKDVAAGPLVRSSYHADQLSQQILNN